MRLKPPLKIIILIMLLILVVSIKPLHGFYYYQQGRAEFNSKDYKEASLKFKRAIDICSDNLTYRYYYAESLAYLLKFDEANAEFDQIIKMSPNSNAAKLSKSESAKIQEYLDKTEEARAALVRSFARQQDNYINGITRNGQIMHWNLNKMPLKLFIDGSGASAEQVNIAKKAFENWINSLSDILTYKMADNSQNADIVISFTGNVNVYKNQNGDSESSAGVTTPKFDGNILKLIDIKISLLNSKQEQVSLPELYSVVLHEIGHALGIGAHSYYESDIMYPIVNDKGRMDNVHLSYRDINTVRLLYKLDADISNFGPEEINKKRNDFNSLILGSAESRYENELKEAKNYTDVSPNSPYSWTKLGEAYHNLKKYNDAISCFNKALTIDSKYIPAKERLAYVYLDLGDNNGAINEFTGLIATDPGNIIYAGNLALLYININKRDQARSVINALVAANPRANEDETIKNITLALDNKNIKLNIVKE